MTPPGQRPAKRQRLAQASAGEEGGGNGAGAEGGDWAPAIVAGIARRSKDSELLVQVRQVGAAYAVQTFQTSAAPCDQMRLRLLHCFLHACGCAQR